LQFKSRAGQIAYYMFTVAIIANIRLKDRCKITMPEQNSGDGPDIR